MTRAYSLDLRMRVVSAVLSGETCRAVGKRFDVSVSSVVKWSMRYRQTGSAAAHRVGGHRPFILAPERGWLLQQLATKPDLTLHALLGKLSEERGVTVSCDTLWRFVKREKLRFKKNRVRH